MLDGGQMAMLHGLVAGRVATRASQDVDVLADLLTDAGLVRGVRAVRELDLEPQPETADKVYRLVRPVTAPGPTFWPPSTCRRGGGYAPTAATPSASTAGTQALRRAMPVRVVKGDRSAVAPVPDLLGSLVAKAAACATHSRDRERHSGNAALRASLVFRSARRARPVRRERPQAAPAAEPVAREPGRRPVAPAKDAVDDGHANWQLLVR